MPLRGGHFVDVSGNILGIHEGYPFYTVGQRKGLGIALGEPALPDTDVALLCDGPLAG